MFAVVESGNKQYRVAKGDVIKVDKIANEVGAKFDAEKVLAVGEKIGVPIVAGAKVQMEVLEHRRTDKIIVFKKKRRQNYRRKHGHKQDISVLRVIDIKS